MHVPIVLVLFSVLSRRVHALYASDITIMNTGYVETHNDDIVNACRLSLARTVVQDRELSPLDRSSAGTSHSHSRRKWIIMPPFGSCCILECSSCGMSLQPFSKFSCCKYYSIARELRKCLFALRSVSNLAENRKEKNVGWGWCTLMQSQLHSFRVSACACMCMCVCVWERERGGYMCVRTNGHVCACMHVCT